MLASSLPHVIYSSRSIVSNNTKLQMCELDIVKKYLCCKYGVRDSLSFTKYMVDIGSLGWILERLWHKHRCYTIGKKHCFIWMCN